MFKWIKKQFSRVWNFIKKHFHKAAAVVGAGAVMVTAEVFGLFAVDMLLGPIAMISIFGLIALCFGYFLVIFSSIMIGQSLFNWLWSVCDLTKPEELNFNKLYPTVEDIVGQPV